MKKYNLVGNRYGKLVVLEETDMRTRDLIVWKCQCDCGNICYVDTRMLMNHGKLCCGCSTSEIIKEHKAYLYVDGTSLHAIMQKKSSNNKSGCRGVCYYKEAKSWRAYISFKKKRYYLGYYKNIEDAKKARKDAEQHLYGSFIDYYKDKYPDEWKKISASNNKSNARKG